MLMVLGYVFDLGIIKNLWACTYGTFENKQTQTLNIVVACTCMCYSTVIESVQVYTWLIWIGQLFLSVMNSHTQHTHTPTAHPHTHTHTDCLFLRYGKSVRHCPMPSPITLSTVKNLYRNLFDISDHLLNDPDCSLYFRPRGVRQWEKLVNIR